MLSILDNPLFNRPKGGIPITISTSVAIETLCGINPERPIPKGMLAPYKYYDHLCINMSTLVRNMIGSIKADNKMFLSERKIKEALVMEMQTINDAIEEHTNGRISCSYYYNSYEEIKKVFKGDIKSKFTDKQLMNYTLEKNVPPLVTFREFNYEKTKLFITQGKRKTLLLTHYPADLFLFKNDVMSLLESHTGSIKTATHFNTKLKHGADYIPFNKYTMQIFGDTGDMFVPMDIKTRRAVSEHIKESGMPVVIQDKNFLKIMHKSKEPLVRNAISKLT